MSRVEDIDDIVEDKSSIFRILISTDSHLGYGKDDPVLYNDSFETFEEVLKLAVSENVDFILLSGDLFHFSKPTPDCLNRCLKLLRKYCLGQKEADFQFVSDENDNFAHCNFKHTNISDPNLQVSLPIFSIHGNHDDPTGLKPISVLDILSTCGFVNYFGKWTDLNNIQLIPLLFTKNQTRLAVYGLSHLRDDRLKRLVNLGSIKIYKPHQEWFNIMLLHQNRVARGQTMYVRDIDVPFFMNFVIWGHEHDSIPEPDIIRDDCHILQPGSTVATSLSKGESLPKHAFLLKVHGKQFSLHRRKLKTVRPFLFSELSLISYPSNQNSVDIITKKLEDMINSISYENENQLNENKKLPLIRLKIIIDEHKSEFNSIKVQQEFSSRIQNFMTCLSFRRENRIEFNSNTLIFDDLSDTRKRKYKTVYDFIEKFYRLPGQKRKMQFLSIKPLNLATQQYTEREEYEAFESVIIIEKEDAHEKLKAQCGLNEDKYGDEEFELSIINCIKQFSENRVIDEENYERRIEQKVRELRKETDEGNKDDEVLSDIEILDLEDEMECDLKKIKTKAKKTNDSKNLKQSSSKNSVRSSSLSSSSSSPSVLRKRSVNDMDGLSESYIENIELSRQDSAEYSFDYFRHSKKPPLKKSRNSRA